MRLLLKSVSPHFTNLTQGVINIISEFRQKNSFGNKRKFTLIFNDYMNKENN